MEQTGLYIHVPFCVRKCQYCDFLSFCAGEEEREQYVKSLCNEISRATEHFPKNRQIDTIFIGGGTPSLLSIQQMEQIMGVVQRTFVIDPHAEISMECNPGTTTQERLLAYRQMGLNRLSFGVQSLQSRELSLLGRIHTRQEAIASYEMARRAGFENINIDLMSGIPEQTLESYEATLREVCQMAPEHISAYSLIVEEGTPFYELYSEEPPVSEDIDRRMYERTKELLSTYGYDRYEISNYAKKGYESKHNVKYWSGVDYIGVGLGASSKIANIRYKNESDMKTYTSKIQRGFPVYEIEEVLSREDEIAEFFILGLRKTQGVSLQEFANKFASNVEEIYGKSLVELKELGFIEQEKEMLRLTEQGIDVSNQVLAYFL